MSVLASANIMLTSLLVSPCESWEACAPTRPTQADPWYNTQWYSANAKSVIDFLTKIFTILHYCKFCSLITKSWNMESNLGLINSKGIRKHSCLLQSNKPFSHCSVAVCTYPSLPTSFWLAFLSKPFLITYLFNITWHVMLSVREETPHTFSVQSPCLTARKITKREQTQGWVEERACGQVVTDSLINILDWFTLLCQKQMCHFHLKTQHIAALMVS